MFKKIIVALMLVMAVFSLTGCKTTSVSKVTTTMADGVVERYYVNDVEVTYEIYQSYGGK